MLTFPLTYGDAPALCRIINTISLPPEVVSISIPVVFLTLVAFSKNCDHVIPSKSATVKPAFAMISVLIGIITAPLSNGTP